MSALRAKIPDVIRIVRAAKCPICGRTDRHLHIDRKPHGPLDGDAKPQPSG